MGNSRSYRIEALLILTSCLFLGFQNCSGNIKGSGAGAASAQNLQSEISKLNASLTQLNDNLSCSGDSDCEIVAYGSRACGGPSGYMVSSLSNVNFNEILEIADKLTEKEMLYNVAMNVVGTCEYMMPPQVRCVSSLCQ